MSLSTGEFWGQTADGQTVNLFTLRNRNGVEARITNYGGRLVSLICPDRKGTPGDIVLGFNDLAGYERKNPYFGALVGRYANRIANAQFSLDGTRYQLAANNGENSLHGGVKGFDKVVWAANLLAGQDNALEFSYLSRDGEEGYPGNLSVKVRYRLSESNELEIEYRAATDKSTVLNLTNHSYFDLSGTQAGHILDYIVTINADRFTPVNQHLIPTGELRPVESTPFDFRTPMRIGSRIDADDEQLKLALGYDHNFVLRDGASGPRLAARAVDEDAGRVLEVLTTEPGVQFYTGNHLDGSVSGKHGDPYAFRTGFCFETQHFPDSPNQPNFPSVVLQPRQEFHSATVFRVSTE